MKFRALQRLRYLVEVFLSRGAFAQLALVAALIVSISLVFGALEHKFSSGETRSLGESIWWAFLRLTDPGYLGDDVGVTSRSFSTILTVLGYVLFMGSLVAILTQWLNRTIQNLEAGFTPIIRDHHILVAGSNDQAELVVQSLFESYGRARRFLARRGKGKQMHVVLLSDQAGSELRLRLQSALGSQWHSQHFTMRKGVPWDNDDLIRVDFSRASVVILPAKATNLAQSTDADNETMKTLLSASHFFAAKGKQELPGIVVEIYDARKLRSITSAYHGPVHSVASSRLLAQLITRSFTCPGIIDVYAELMQHNDGNEIYLREGSLFVGLNLEEISKGSNSAIPIGVVSSHDRKSSERAQFSLDPSKIIVETDLVAFIARSFEDTLPQTKSPSAPGSTKQIHSQQLDQSQLPNSCAESLLILGWNRKGEALVQELLSNHIIPISNIHISTRLNIEELEHAPWWNEATSSDSGPVIHRIDNTVPDELASLDPASFNHIVILSSDWLNDEARADARAIATLLSLEQKVQRSADGAPHIVVELLDPSNASVTRPHADDLLLSADLIGHLLAQIALRPEIKQVYDALLSTAGPGIDIRRCPDYGYDEGSEIQFSDFQERARQRGEIAIGIFYAAANTDKVCLNPPSNSVFGVAAGTRLLVVSTT